MSNTWVTSDTHFGHANIIRHCARPFTAAHDMDEFMIAAWNARVMPGDVVWHLGDFFSFKPAEVSAERAREVRARLNGSIRLLRGNHDVQPWIHTIGVELYGAYVEIREQRRLVVLSHYPIESWNGRHHGSLHLHGHTHGSSLNVPRRIDVGVDCTGGDFAPLRLDGLLLGNSPE